MSRWSHGSLLGAVLTTMLIVPPAQAKGGGYLDFERLYYAPGEPVHLETAFSTDAGGLPSRLTGSIDDGPYHAYLLPVARSIHPPRIPKGALPLGRILFEGVGQGDGRWRASIAFVIPHADPGAYHLVMCDDPCRHTGVGDLGGSSFHLEATPEEARLKNLLHDWVGETIEAWIPEPDLDLRSDLHAFQVNDALRDTRTRLEIGEEMDGLREQLAGLREQVQRGDEQSRGIAPALWLSGWLVAAGVAATWWTASRRRRVRA